MPGTVSLAEHYRAHQEAFELVLRLGCTPKDAERKLCAEKRARHRVCGTAAPITVKPEDMVPMEMGQDQEPADFAAWSAPWMMRTER